MEKITRRTGIKMIKELVSPTNFNVLASKLSDVLVRAVDAPLGYAINWGRVWSLWPVHLETACCSVEFGAASGPRFDVERFGIIEAFEVQPLPIGSYVITYSVTDEVSGESFQLEKDITVAERE